MTFNNSYYTFTALEFFLEKMQRYYELAEFCLAAISEMASLTKDNEELSTYQQALSDNALKGAKHYVNASLEALFWHEDGEVILKEKGDYGNN